MTNKVNSTPHTPAQPVPADKPFNQLTPNEVLQVYLLEGRSGLAKRATPLDGAKMFLKEGWIRYLPSDPRCIWCAAPFTGLGAPFMRAMNKDRSRYNPAMCTECESFVREHNAGVEVEMSLIFADIRGSTTLAEKMDPAEFSQVVNRFYTTASDILTRERAFIEKLAGDQVSAFLVPGLAGPQHYKRAIEAAHQILKATGHEDPAGPWVPVGIGVHSGVAFFGAVGTAQGLTELTTLGDPPNTAARLASTAKAGEILVSDRTAQKAELDTAGLEKRSLQLKGKTETVDVWVLTANSTP